MPETMTAEPATDIVVSRLIRAPRELVFDAFANTDRISKWWGPRGFTTTTHESDFRPGGTWRFTMHGPDGTNYKNRIIYETIERPERLSYQHAGEGDHDHIQFVSVVTFEQQSEGTIVTLRARFATAVERDRSIRENGAVEGGRQTLARLAENVEPVIDKSTNELTMTLPSDREIRLIRVIDAPRELVFEAFSKPEHIKRWWGSSSFEMPVCEMDFRVGGTWRFVQRAPDGTEHPFTGVYRIIDHPTTIEYTFVYDVEMVRDFEAIETIELTELAGKTVIINTMIHATKEARDGMVASGMESGAAESFDRLATLVASMK